MSALAAFGLWFVVGLLSVVDPLYPPNAVWGGTVVAELHFVAGKVQDVTILSGKKPFADSCRSALAQWRMNSEENADELVVVHFRQPALYYWGDTEEEISPAKPKRSLPYPSDLILPSYPVNALGQGSVILRTSISAEGRVSDVRVIKPVGVLTDTSIDAVRRWKFTPAEDDRGARTSSHAYAVLVYRLPVIAP
jgi:TonB family protein